MSPPPATTATTAALAPERLLELWQHANDVLYVHDLGGRFVAVNATAARTYGYSEAELLAMSIRDLVDPAHLPVAMANLKAKASGSTDRSAPYELLTRAKDGRPVWVEVSTRIVADAAPPVVQGTARDITARKLAEAGAELVHEAALALDTASSLEAGVQDAIARIATAAGWTYAEAWFPDPEGRTLQLGPQWTSGEGLEKFVRLTRQYRFTPDEGLPGRVWKEGKPTWGADILGDEQQFPRGAAARAAGLGIYAAVPVLHDGRVAAVLVFLGPRASGEDARWVAAAERVAAHIGAAIRRRLDAERVRAAGRMFAAQFEALDDALLLLDPDGVPSQANAAFLQLCEARVVSTDPVVPIAERVDDKASFLAAVASLYEDRSAGRDQAVFRGRTYARAVQPLRSRSGKGLGVLLRLVALEADAAVSSRPAYTGKDVC